MQLQTVRTLNGRQTLGRTFSITNVIQLSKLEHTYPGGMFRIVETGEVATLPRIVAIYKLAAINRLRSIGGFPLLASLP